MLSDVVVLELGQRESAGWCGRLLADLGAQVCYLDSGDVLLAPEGRGSLYLRGGKRKVSHEADAGKVDVVITDGADSATCARTALLKQRNPALVTVSVSDYGLTGPMALTPASELTLQAEAGIVALHPTGRRPPVAMGIALAEQVAGRWAAAAALMGLLVLDVGADSVEADVSRFESLASVLQVPWLYQQLSAAGHYDYPVPQMAVPGIEPCRDGWVCIVAVSPDQWLQFKRLVDNPALDDARFDVIQERIRLADEVRPLIRDFTLRYSAAELVALGVQHHIPVVPVTTPETVAAFTPYAERDVVRAVTAGGIAVPRPSWLVTESKPCMRPDRDSVAEVPTVELPLRGLRVVEIGSFQAGPQVGAHLAALGADVIRIESVSRPDSLRFLGPHPDIDRFWERGASYLGINLGKRAVTADLSDPQGRRITERLIASADVVVENYVPRVLDGRGLDYAGVRALREDIVMLRMPAWGSTGQWRDNPGFTFTANAAAGLSSLTGYPDDEPLLTGTIIDPIAGLVATVAVLAAIRRQRRDHAGALIEVPLCDVALELTALHLEAVATGKRWSRCGNRRGDLAPQGVYRTRDHRWVALTVACDLEWLALCEFARKPHWAADTHLATTAGRLEWSAELDNELAEFCSGLDSESLIGNLRERGIAAAPVLIGTDLAGHPQLIARQRVFSVDHPLVGSLQYVGFPVRFAHAPAAAAPGPAPLFGQHSREVLIEIGYSEAEVDDLAAAGGLGRSPFNLPFIELEYQG